MNDYKISKINNFYEMLFEIYNKYAQRIAIKYRENNQIVNITYEEMIQVISNIYKYYKDNKINNVNIGIVSENRYEYIPIYLATIFNNVIVPIDKEYTSEEIDNIIKKFDIKILFYTNKTENKIPLKTEISILNIDKLFSKSIFLNYDIKLFFNDIKNTNSNKFSVIALTSGTMGIIKGAMLTQKNITTNIKAPLEYIHLEGNMLQILPMNHTYGFNPGVLSPLCNGDTVCINKNLKTLMHDFKEYNPYYIGAVPLIIEGIYKNIIRVSKSSHKYKMFCILIKISNFCRKYKVDLRHILFGNIINKNLRTIVCGGAPLSDLFVKKFDELGITVLNGYGMTECSPLVSVNKDFYNVWGSVGTIIRGTDVKIAKDGEILVKGPNVMLGYYNDEFETKKSFSGGYFKTGDLGYKKNNILYITGRKKNLIILKNGKNFSPEFIESKLLSISYIKECLIVLTKKNNSEIIVAKVRLNEQQDINKINYDISVINKTLPKYMNIDKVEIVYEDFVKTSTNKIVRNKYV